MTRCVPGGRGAKRPANTMPAATFSIRVVKAKAIDGDWRASKLVGTITQYDAPQLGCVTGRATISITLTLIG